MFIKFNNNPRGARVGDCVVRAISAVTGQEWDETYSELCAEGFLHKDMPSSNCVWSQYLYNKGFRKNVVDGMQTIAEFSAEHRHGKYLLATGTHLVALIDGNYLDTWDSGQEEPAFYFVRR